MRRIRVPPTYDPRWLAQVLDEILGDSDSLSGYATDADLAAHVAATDPHPDLIADLSAASSVAEADNLVVSQSGTQRRATVNQLTDAVFGDDWDDLVVPGTVITPPGAASDPDLSPTTGLLEFSASADDVIIFVWQLPHGWTGAWDASNAVVVPHLHVRHLTSTSAPNNVSRWKFEYDAASVNGNFSNAYASFTTLGTVSSTNPANTAKGGIISFGNLDLAGKGVSTIVHARVSRLAATDGADTDTSVIALYSADLHIRRRRWGTEQEYTD